MKKQLNYLFILLGLLTMVLTSCNTAYNIEGNSTIATLDGRKLYLKTFKGGEWLAIDSTEVLHGGFTMEGCADTARFVALYMDDESIMPLILENGNIKITISPSYMNAEGTPLNDALYGFIAKQNEQENQMLELERKEARMVLDGANIDEIRPQLQKEADELSKEMESFVKDFIVEHYEDVLGPSVFIMLGNSLPYPIMTPLFEDVVRTAPTQFRENELVKDFLEKARENKLLLEEHQRMQENAIVNQNSQR